MSAKGQRPGVLSRLIRRFTGGVEDASPAAPANPIHDRIVDDEFRLAIDTLCQDREGMYQTRLQIISLVEFREAVGDRWSRLADKVMLIAEGVIQSRIGKGNLYARQGQDFFVLVFRACSQEEGRYRALTIAQDLGVRLLGDQFDGLDRPLALAAEVTLADALTAEGGLSLAAIDKAVGVTRAEQAEAEEEAGLRRSLMPSEGLPADAGGIRRSLLPGGPAAAPGSERAGDIGELPSGRPPRTLQEPGWEAMAVERRDKADPAWHDPDGGAGQPAPLAERDLPPPPPPQPVAAGALTPETRLSVGWRPTWVASGEAIAAYAARIRRDDGTAGTVAGGRAYPIDADTINTLDSALLEKAAALLTDGTGIRCPLILPLHWATMTSPRRMALTRPLASLSDAQRADRIAVELFGIPVDVGARPLTEAVRAARALGREVRLRTSLAAPLAGLAADCGCAGIGIDLDEIATDIADDLLLAHLARYCAGAGRARLSAHVWGCRRRSQLAGAVGLGAALVNGPALMKDVDRPGPRLPAPKARLAGALPPRK
jgi:GGDEF domain-containing protein